MESLLAGYLRMVSIINVIIVVNQVSVIIKILTDVVDVIFFIITITIITIKTVRFTSSSSSLAYDHILAYLLKTSLHHYFLTLTKSRLRPKARGQKRATKLRDEHRTSMNRKQALRKSIIVYHYINI